jgi:hypothetical protein
VTLENGRKIKLHTIEEMAYGLCIGILEKTYSKINVTPDSLKKLQQLIPYIDIKLFSEIVHENLDQTAYMTEAFGDSINTQSMIQYVIENCRPYTPPGYRFEAYPANQTTAPNGLHVEDPLTYTLAMEQHFTYLTSR